MQVENSTISLMSTREYQKSFHHSKKLNIWNNLSPKKSNSPPANKPNSSVQTSENYSFSDPRLQSIKLVLEALTGKKVEITDFNAYRTEPYNKDTRLSTGSQSLDNQPEMQGWGIDFQENISITETEQNTIMASGIIKTKQGKTIKFSLDLSMKREFQTSADFSFKAGDALIDPLVINLDGNAADLGKTKFKFDINSDGEDENLAWLNGSRGFLVLDKNHDGIVNNGTELFGPTSGNGFNELLKLDYDNNGFIDENDPMFQNLMIWSGKTREDSCLTDLKHHNIGAIGLINVKSEFSLKDEQYNTLGKIQRTGIYLKENGQAGTIQQLDLSV